MKKARVVLRRPVYRNKLEAAMGAQLEAEHRAGQNLWWGYEKMKFRLADGAIYTPDFCVIRLDGTMLLLETKGHLREAAGVRFKVAAEQYPFATWRMVRLVRGQWDTMMEYGE